MVEVRYVLFAFVIALAFSVAAVHAIGVYVTDSSPSFTILVGNLSQAYDLNITMNSTDRMNNTNLSVIMPYGIEVTTPGCVANVTVANTFTCVQILATAANTTVNMSVKANLSAYPTYGNQSFNFSVVADGTPANNTLKSVFGVNFWRNPRPQVTANGTSGNQTLRFEKWNQTDPTYKVQVPIWIYNATSGRPQMAGNTYGDVLYFDRSFFEIPNYMRLWGYNLSFRIIYGGQDTSTFYIRSPINNSNNTMNHQGLAPILMQTTEQTNPMENVTFNMTIGVPAASGMFTVFFNNTRMNDTVLLRDYGVNITYSGGDQSAMLLTVVANSSNLSLVNNTEMYIMFTTLNLTACQGGGICQTSPVYVTVQQNNGLDFNQPPKFGQSLNISFLVNVTNRLTNYTLQDLRLSFMQPMNVTANESGTIRQFNMTLPNQVKLQIWNTSASWVENLSSIRTDSNITFTEGMGPGAGTKINLYVSTFDVLISNSTATFSNWDPATSGSSYAYVNFTAEMAFPVLDETAVPSGSAGTNNSYNVSMNSPVQSFINLTEKVPGISSSSTGVVVTIDGAALASSNYTIGSLVVNVPSGQHSISVSYVVPATATATTTSTSSSSSGGTGTSTDRRIQIWSQVVPGTDYYMNVSHKDIPISEIYFGVVQSATSAKLSVEAFSAKPSNTTTPSGNIYKYMSITPTNLESNLKNIKIRFEVNYTWLTDNGLKPEDIVMQRYVNSEWQALATSPISRAGNKYLFEAITPGFSYFVITSGAVQEQPQPTPAPVPEEELPPPPPELPPVELPQPPAEQPLPFETSVLIIVGAVLLIIIGGYLYFHKFGK